MGIDRLHGWIVPLNVKHYLINYPHLSEYGQTIFCLSFPSRDRATAPGRYEQFYFTEHVPYSQKIHFEDAIRSEDPVQLLCNSLFVYSIRWQGMITHSYFNALCTAKRVQFITGGYSPVPKVALYSFYVCQTFSGQLLGLPQISLESIRLPSFYVCQTSSGQLLGLPQ